MSEWRDIGSAPKDRDILVKGGIIWSQWGEGEALSVVALVRWDNTGEVWEILPAAMTADFWIKNPTHWHPVPEV